MEQSCVVWHRSLTKENEEDLERVQKSAIKFILERNFDDYSKALSELNLDLLKNRREELCVKVAIQCPKSEKTQEMFPKREKEHKLQARMPG